jgi:hypothetical protein
MRAPEIVNLFSFLASFGALIGGAMAFLTVCAVLLGEGLSLLRML